MLRRAWRTRCVALRRARGERIASPGSLVYHTRPRGLLRAEGVAVLIAANWKMHGDRAFLAAYFEGAAALSWPTAQTHLVFPPATLLERAAEAAARAGLGLVPGAQAIHGALDGAHTGCLSAEQVAEAGARWALLGHSERRALGETDLDVAAQLEAAARAGLRGLVCVGEGLEVREGGGAEAHVLAQLAAVLSVSAPALEALGAIAYEPIWAIGTGRTATPEVAQAMHRALREMLEAAGLGGLPLLYGGSVKPDNAKALLSQPDIDGVLVGGASLDITAFNAIARAASE